MAEEKAPNKAKEFMSRHGEKLGLGVAAAAFLAYLVLGILMAKEDTSARDLKTVTDRLDAERRKRHERFSAPEVKVDSGAVLAPWNTVTTAKPGGDAVARSLPVFEFKELTKPAEIVRKVMVPSIAFGTTAVDFDGVTITWTVNEFTKAEMTKNAKDTDYLKLTGLVIERETNGNGKWEKVKEVDVKDTTYKDSNINPKTKYAYRITSIPEPDKKSRPEAKGMTVNSPSVSTQAIWKLGFGTPSKPAGAAKGMAYLTIEKYEKGKGAVTVKHIQYAGDKIGVWEETAGSGDATGVHRVFKDSKALQVDFNTGYTLNSIEPTKVTIEVKKCRKKYDKGVWTGECTQETAKHTVDTFEIVYTDDEGEKKLLSPNPRDNKAYQDDLCENHGGKKIEVKRPDAPATPDQPKADPKVVAAQKKEADAAKLYDDALKDEAAKNKKAAYDKFQKLLSSFADTDFVSKQHKTEIEERAARNK